MIDVPAIVSYAVDLTFPAALALATAGAHQIGKKVLPHFVWALVQERVDGLARAAVQYAANVVKDAAPDVRIETPEVARAVLNVAREYFMRSAPALSKLLEGRVREVIIARMNVGPAVALD